MLSPWQRLQLLLYFVPIAGLGPAAWTLLRRTGSREQQRASRLAIATALLWLLAYSLLSTGAAHTSGIWHIRLLLLDTFAASSYFLACLVLMAQVWRRQSASLPGVSAVAAGRWRPRSPKP